MAENLPDSIKYWLAEANYDCFFVVGPKNGPTKRIGAMKTLLMGHSEPLRAMLQDSELAEKGDIHLTDVEPATFQNFLKCVYGGSDLVIPKLTFDESAKLLYLVEKYLVNEIKPKLLRRVESTISSDKIFLALSHPICYQEETLEKTILNILLRDLNKIMIDDKFLDLTEDAVMWLLQQENLDIREIEIWNAVLRWAKRRTESEDNKILHWYILDLLKHIRFLAMNCKEFWSEVVPSNILLKEEVDDICKSFATSEPPSIEYLCGNKRYRYKVSEKITSSFNEHLNCAFICCTVDIREFEPHIFENSESYDWLGQTWRVQIKKSERRERWHTISTLHVRLTRKMHIQNSHKTTAGATLINQSDKSGTSKSEPLKEEFYSRLQSGTIFGDCVLCDWSSLSTNGFVKDNRIIVITRIQQDLS